MEFILLGFLLGVFIWILMGGSKSFIQVTCDKIDKPHKWVYKGEHGNNYMVCSVCKMLPGEGFEEGNSRDEDT